MTKTSAPAKEPEPHPSDALKIGTKLDGYRIQSILGRGTFGITYLAEEEHLDRLVAIKEYFPIDFAVRDKDGIVRPRTGSHGELFQYGLESFLKEAKTLVKFKHHNIVLVLNYFEQYETAYLVMEYEVGQDLNSYFKEHPQLSESELLAIFSPVNEGLEVVHQHGFIHRDIKPDNIYIRQDKSPVLLDFGAARDVIKTKADQLTRIMTAGYAPYEQDNPAWADQGPWTDIYALGTTLYIAVMNRKPVNSSKRAAAFMMKQEDPYISALNAIDKNYSRPFLSAIDKALEFHPKDRPQSLSEWNQMLTVGLNDATVIMPSSRVDTSDAVVIKPSSSTGKGVAIKKTFDWNVGPEVDMPGRKRDRGNRLLPIVAATSVIVLAVTVGGYLYWKSVALSKDEAVIVAQTDIPEDLVSSALILAKTACWHYARGNKIRNLIEKIKGLPSTSDRTKFIADQMKKLHEAENGFEKNFSQYSISIIKLRRYPVGSINQAIDYFLQLPDYRNDRGYKVIAEFMTDHATGGTLNTEKWKNDFINISVESGVFE
ncbi:MAG: serine/threonine-protein kinase [Pseudomonadota bacterium]